MADVKSVSSLAPSGRELWVTKARLWGEGRRVHSEPRVGVTDPEGQSPEPGPADTRRAPWRRGASAVSACVPGVGGVPGPWTGSLDTLLGLLLLR